MAEDKEDKKSSIKGAFTPGKAMTGKDGRPVLFLPEEMDIYCNKITKETFIFHGKPLDYENLDRMVYDPKTYTVEVYKKDGSVWDLGVKIQWLVRPYFSKAEEVQIVRTHNGKAIDGTFLPITHKGK